MRKVTWKQRLWVTAVFVCYIFVWDYFFQAAREHHRAGQPSIIKTEQDQ